MNHGGRQELHPEFYNWFPRMLGKKEKIMLSDSFLKRSDFSGIMSKINERQMRNIVIIGGSHSGFSAAWLLLNGPADIYKNSHVRPQCHK